MNLVWEIYPWKPRVVLWREPRFFRAWLIFINPSSVILSHLSRYQQSVFMIFLYQLSSRSKLSKERCLSSPSLRYSKAVSVICQQLFQDKPQNIIKLLTLKTQDWGFLKKRTWLCPEMYHQLFLNIYWKISQFHSVSFTSENRISGFGGQWDFSDFGWLTGEPSQLFHGFLSVWDFEIKMFTWVVSSGDFLMKSACLNLCIYSPMLYQ